MPKIAIIDKAPSKTDYKKYFNFDFEVFHMSSIPVAKLLKKNVDLQIDLDPYDFVILVGAEAAKEYAKVSVTNNAGLLTNNKFIPITNPGILVFKPEGKAEFTRCVDRIHKYVSGELYNTSIAGDFGGIHNAEEALAFLQEVYDNADEVVALDTEGTALYPRDGYVLGLSVTYKENHGRYILTDVLDVEHLELLQKIINKYRIVFHNMKYDLKMIEFHIGVKFDRTRVEDTMLMHYVLDENSPHGLKPLAIKYTEFGDYDADLATFKKEYCAQHGIKSSDFTYDLIPFDIICRYASIDTAATFALRAKFRPIVYKNEKLRWVYENLLVAGTLFLMDMEEVGIPISPERMHGAGKYLNRWIEQSLDTVYSFPEVTAYEKDTNVRFNPKSPIQLRKVLFDYAKLQPTGRLTKTGALSTDKEVLKELGATHKLPSAILRVRELTKIQSSYVAKILPALDRDNRIRTNFNLIFTTSGRLSSSGKFNAQQIPRDNPIIKGCIQAPPGYKIVSQDLATAEVYYAAVLSGDKNLQSVFKQGGDLHATIAKMVFNLDCEVGEVKALYPALRQAAKAITFGILYGSGPAKVAESVTKATGETYSLDQAKENIRDYFIKFSTLKKWLETRKLFIEANGYTYSFFGRKRRLVNVFSADKGIAAHEVRSGINMEIQSLASDMNLLGAMDTQREVNAAKLDAKIFMLVHDSIVAIVKDEHVDEYCRILRVCTQKDRGCSIPGFPVGVDQEVAQDYSFYKEKDTERTETKFEKMYRLEGDELVLVEDSKPTVNVEEILREEIEEFEEETDGDE